MIEEKLATLGVLASGKLLGLLGMIAPSAAVSAPPLASPQPARYDSPTAGEVGRDDRPDSDPWLRLNHDIAEAAACAARAQALHHQAAIEIGRVDAELATLRRLLARSGARDQAL
ncbi:MAG: hypothetical protein AB7O57_10900 [Hyphomicrobiaceae bacterium]